VDLGRNDLGRVSKPGTVRVNSYGQIKKYSKVMHMVSKVQGRAKESATSLAGLKSTFPAGTVSGAPKLKAIEIIKNLETDNRDEYAGTVFMHNLANSLDSFISIRFIRIKNNELTIQSGSGIVHDSIAKDEYKEILNKASALFKSVEDAHEGEILYDFIN